MSLSCYHLRRVEKEHGYFNRTWLKLNDKAKMGLSLKLNGHHYKKRVSMLFKRKFLVYFYC